MTNERPVLAGAVAAAMLCASAAGEAVADDKSRYTLFSPTPDRLLRSMTTDRPDITEVPFTVDAGRVQIESTVFGYARSRPDEAGAVSDTYEFAVTNVRIGVTNDAEIGFVWQPYGIVRTREPGMPTLREDGIGALTLRAKLNLWGNDTFDRTGSALALLPFLTLPTDRHNGISTEFVEGGLVAPFAVKLPGKFSLGVNAGAAWLRDDAESGYHVEYLASASLAYEWSSSLGTYVEVAGLFHTGDPRGDVVIIGTGVTYRIGENLQLDAGVNVGVSDAADRINPFIGVSRRF